MLVIDIGCGVLTRRLVEFCASNGHELVLLDSPEMLDELPEAPQTDEYSGRADAVALVPLAPGGALLIGDVPNISKRNRFFASERGVAFHWAFMGSSEAIRMSTSTRSSAEKSTIRSSSACWRARAQGFDAFVLPQPPDLRLANRREDIFMRRP